MKLIKNNSFQPKQLNKIREQTISGVLSFMGQSLILAGSYLLAPAPTRKHRVSNPQAFTVWFVAHGVCLAIFVSKHAVVSYTAISPLPLRAVSFLLHFPSDHSARQLAGVFTRCYSDFPH